MITLYAVDGKFDSKVYKTMDEAMAMAEPEDGVSELTLLDEPLETLINLMNDGGFNAKRREIRERTWDE